MQRRGLVAGAVASALPLAGSHFVTAAEAGTEPDPGAVGPGKLDVVLADGRGRILVADSLSYYDERTGVDDVVLGGSYAGASAVSTVFPTGAKAIIAHDAGIGKAQAGISGLAFCDKFGIPMAAVAGRTASLSNGNSLLNGTISSVNDAAGQLGVRAGQPTRQAAELLLQAKPGRPLTEKVGIDLELHEMAKLPSGRVLARVWLLDLSGTYPNDVFALGTHSARVAAEHAFRWNVKGWIANDAGMAKNNSGIAALGICGERGMPAASVSAASASIGNGLSTYHDGIVSAANEPARRKGVMVGMPARDALQKMAV